MPISNIAVHTAFVIKRLPATFSILSDFVNAGTIQVIHSGLTLDILGTGIAPTYQTVTNRGLIEAACGSLTIHGNRAFTTNFATIVNTGTILALGGGLIDIQADMHQGVAGTVAIQGGTVLLEGAATGGTIQITQGTLAFGLYGRGAPGGPIAAGLCTASIQFIGHDGMLDFGRADITEVFRADTQDLLVSVPSGGRSVQIADLHLGGRVYSAADFTVRGNDIVFQH